MTDPVFKIIEKCRRDGIASVTADDSAEIKGFIREHGEQHALFPTLLDLFPCECAEAAQERIW